MSSWIQIQQSVRQGGVLSPWLYMVYINELPELLQKSGQGCSISSVFSGAPIQADDVCLLSPTVLGLQKMIDIVQEFAYKWRYELNPSKSKILVFGEDTRRPQNETTYNWTLNGNLIEKVCEEKHVGIILNTSIKSIKRTKEACRKGRNTFMSLTNIGASRNGLNPLTSMHLTKLIVLPRALYGAELWNDITVNETKILERMLRFCCKNMQGLGQRCRSDVCTAMLGSMSIEAMVDVKKLTFLGRIVNLQDSTLANKVLRSRILQFECHKYIQNGTVTFYQVGFVPDMIRLINKYDLSSFWDKYISSGFQEFPAQTVWKQLVKKTVFECEQKSWEMRTIEDATLEVFRKIHNTVNKPAKIWTFAKKYPQFLAQCRVMAQFLAKPQYCDIEMQLCIYCGRFYTDIYLHMVLVCSKCSIERDLFWDKTVNIMSVEISAYLHNLEDEELYCAMLGAPLNLMTDETESDTFLQISGAFLTQILKYKY